MAIPALKLKPVRMQYKKPSIYQCPHCQTQLDLKEDHCIWSYETETAYCDKVCMILSEARYANDWEQVEYDGRIWTEDQFIKHMEVETIG